MAQCPMTMFPRPSCSGVDRGGFLAFGHVGEHFSRFRRVWEADFEFEVTGCRMFAPVFRSLREQVQPVSFGLDFRRGLAVRPASADAEWEGFHKIQGDGGSGVPVPPPVPVANAPRAFCERESQQKGRPGFAGKTGPRVLLCGGPHVELVLQIHQVGDAFHRNSGPANRRASTPSRSESRDRGKSVSSV